MAGTGDQSDQDAWLLQEVVARRPADAREWVGVVLARSAASSAGVARYRVQVDRSAVQLEVADEDMVLYEMRVRSRHLLVLWGDLELEIQGPFVDEAARFAAARAIREDSDEDGVHWLDLIEMAGAITPHGGDYAGGALSDDEADEGDGEGADDQTSPRR
jgi:hypothetical protein